MTAARKISIYFLCILFGLLPAYISAFAQSKDLDAKKWVTALSKKDRSSYDSLTSLVITLQKVDSLRAFQFLDELSEKGRSKGDHFQALFNCVKARTIYNKCFYEFNSVGKTPPNIDRIKQQQLNLYSSAIDIVLKDDTTANWDELRGIGAEIETPINSCAEENVLCYGEGIDPYYYEDIVIHEFAHTVHALGILFVDPNFETELKEVFENAKANGLWKNTYAGSNESEYFAEGVQCWFNLNAEAIPGDGIHNEINRREELKKYDSALYEIVKRYFPAAYGKISCHQ